MRSLLLTLALVLAVVGQAWAQTPAEADSIVLERGPCFGTCPVYRVSIARSGDVHFMWLHGADSGKTEQRHIDPDKFTMLVHIATFNNFVALPDTIRGPYCPYPLTDLPSAKVSLFLPGREKTVYDYQGCTWAPFILRQIETDIDDEAGTRRWLH